MGLQNHRSTGTIIFFCSYFIPRQENMLCMFQYQDWNRKVFPIWHEQIRNKIAIKIILKEVAHTIILWILYL